MQSYVCAFIEFCVTFWTRILWKMTFEIYFTGMEIVAIVWISFRQALLFQTGPPPQIDNNRANFIKLALNLRKMYGTRCENYEFRTLCPRDCFIKFFIRVVEFNHQGQVLNQRSIIEPQLDLDKCFGTAEFQPDWNCNFEERPLTFSKPGARSNHWASSDYAIQNARYMTLEGDHFPFTGICYEIVVWTAQFWFLGLFILNIVTVIFGNLLEVNWERTITQLHNTALAETWLWRNYFNLE